MFVGVVVENFHRCRAEQEKEERARRAAKRAKKIEERRRSKLISIYYFCKILILFGYNVKGILNVVHQNISCNHYST